MALLTMALLTMALLTLALLTMALLTVALLTMATLLFSCQAGTAELHPSLQPRALRLLPYVPSVQPYVPSLQPYVSPGGDRRARLLASRAWAAGGQLVK